MANGRAKAAAIGRDIRRELSKTLSDVMILAAQNVTDATPVDTEHARSNWVLSTGEPYTAVDGSRENVSYSAQQAGLAKIRSYDIGRDGDIYLRNNVLYLQYLDEGWSQQAPPGFVAIALQGGARAAPHGRKRAARKLLRSVAREAYRRGV